MRRYHHDSWIGRASVEIELPGWQSVLVRNRQQKNGQQKTDNGSERAHGPRGIRTSDQGIMSSKWLVFEVFCNFAASASGFFWQPRSGSCSSLVGEPRTSGIPKIQNEIFPKF
jgi:hypothetical protein